LLLASAATAISRGEMVALVLAVVLAL